MVYLQINLDIKAENRAAAAAIYVRFRDAFLAQVKGALSKVLLVRDDDVQVLHTFESAKDAASYLDSDMFAHDVATALQPLLQRAPEIRIYQAA